MKLQLSSYEHPGPPGKASQDRLSVTRLEEDGLLCVLSDGVGTARDPERCAERVVRLVADNFAARPRQWSTQKIFAHLVEQANESLHREGFYLDGTTSMQATLAVAWLKGNRLFGLNVGDSPILLVRKGETERLSHDHVAKNADGQERVTQTIGMGPLLQPYYFERELASADTIVLTSDGLTKLLDDDSLGRLVNGASTARGVVSEAIRGRNPGDLDDLSAILVRVENLGPGGSEGEYPPAVDFPQPAKGKKFEGYHLINRIAGNDRVWLAKKNDRRYVLKFIPLEAQTDDSGVLMARFAREVWNASRLHGEFFVPAKKPESGNPYYYVMDYIEAPSLGFLLKTRKLSADETVELGKFLCRAGQYLLRHELVHGDIKPDNLLVFREGNDISFKLLDLGLASTVFTEASTSGTPSYLAPERFKGAFLTERTEIFSIGATLYESLTGRKPFGAIERFQTPHHVAPPRLTKWNPNVPPWLECVVLKSLSLKQEHRYPCYSELLFGLAHPEAAPWNIHGGPLLERNPLLFYRTGFWLLLALAVLLTCILLCRH
jgi:serine/threonine protein phosphatase PrpC